MNGLKEKMIAIIKSHNNPADIALGTAVGVFIGCLPLYGLHIVIVLLFALFLPNTNRIAMLMGTNVTMPLTAPFVYWAAYCVGRFMTGSKAPALDLGTIRNITLRDIPGMYYVLFYGCIVLGVVFAAFFYATVLYAAKKIKRHEARA